MPISFRNILLVSSFIVLGLAIIQPASAQVNPKDVETFILRFPADEGYTLESLTAVLDKAQFQPSIIEKMEKPAEGTMTWERYRNIFMKPDRIAAGQAFYKDNQKVIDEVSQSTGVSVEAILGILGVETFFGQRKGSYLVLDALYTLAFGFPKRATFFQSELREYLILAQKENLDVTQVRGSYAGAMGYCQFMPSSYRAYAKSYEADGTRDLINDVNDAIASIANYLKVHRWEAGQPVASLVSVDENPVQIPKQSLKPKNQLSYYQNRGYLISESIAADIDATLLSFDHNDSTEEYWITYNNFYVITRYNHSPLYALAVYQLGQKVMEPIN